MVPIPDIITQNSNLERSANEASDDHSFGYKGKGHGRGEGDKGSLQLPTGVLPEAGSWQKAEKAQEMHSQAIHYDLGVHTCYPNKAMASKLVLVQATTALRAG